MQMTQLCMPLPLSDHHLPLEMSVSHVLSSVHLFEMYKLSHTHTHRTKVRTKVRLHRLTANVSMRDVAVRYI